jgi:alpha-mannosidase
MPYQQLIALLPCHSLDDFPFHLEGAAADEILAAYTLLWHPSLIAEARAVPSWRRNDSDGEISWDEALVALPQVCRDDMPGYWLEELRAAGACVLDCGELGNREAMLAYALEHAAAGRADVDPELVSDFFALGLCHLLTEVLTVRMRYSSLLDGERFSKLLLAAAAAALSGDATETREMLGRCFDALAESKDHFYPVDTFLFDLTLIAPSTPVADLAAELARPTSINLMITANDLVRLTTEDPSLISLMTTAIEADRLCLVGGEFDEQAPLGVLSSEQLLVELISGISVYEQILGTRPYVFGRRKFGLHPQLPQLLSKLGYIGALHQSLDGTRCPESYHGAISWQSLDGTTLTALARMPLSAVDSESVLRLPREMGEAMDHDHVAAIGFAHYPGHVSHWYQQLRRIATFGSVLGNFVGLDACLRDAELMTGPTQFDADDYRTPYLRTSSAAGTPAITPLVTRHREQAARRKTEGIHLLAGCLGQSLSTGTSAAPPLDAVVRALPGKDEEKKAGLLLLNPSSQPQTLVVDLSFSRMPTVKGIVKAAAEQEGQRQAVVELPAMGYGWIAGDGEPWQPSAGRPLVEEHLLRNEFCEVSFDSESGALQSLHMPDRRGNLFSQRLALRLPTVGAKAEARYAQMVAETIQFQQDGPFRASQSVTGRLLAEDGSVVSHFAQTVSILRGVPLLTFDLTLDPLVLPEGNPWQSYYGIRFAWSGDEIYRGVGSVRQRTFRTRIESPDFLDLCCGNTALTLLPGGIPYHTVIEPGQIDTLLIPPGESSRQFTWKLGLGLSAPAETAWSAFVDPIFCSATRQAVAPPSAWVLHVSDPKVIVTHVEFVAVEQGTRIRLRLLETGGRRSRLSLRCFRSFAAARKLDFTFSVLESLSVQPDRVELELAPGELCLVELEFAP